MPATTLTVASIGTTGTDPALQNSDVTNGNQFANTPGRTYALVFNGDASSRTVTFAAQTTTRPADGTFPATTVANVALAVAAGAYRIFGPFPASYNDGNGYVQVSWSASTPTTTKIAPFNIA